MTKIVSTLRSNSLGFTVNFVEHNTYTPRARVCLTVASVERDTGSLHEFLRVGRFESVSRSDQSGFEVKVSQLVHVIGCPCSAPYIYCPFSDCTGGVKLAGRRTKWSMRQDNA